MTEATATVVTGDQRAAVPSVGALAVRETAVALPHVLPPTMYPGQRVEQDAEGGINGRRVLHALRRRWLPAAVVGSLLALACAIPMYLFLPRGYEAVVWLRIRGNASLLGGAADSNEYEAYRKTQIALLKSPVVLHAALRRPGISSLRTITDEDDPVRWLADSLQTDGNPASEVLQLKLRAPVAEEAAKILNAVTTCYLDDIVNKDRQDRLARRDALEKKYRENQSELRSKKESVIQLAKTLGSSDSEEVATHKALLMEHLSQVRGTLYDLQRQQRQLDEELAAAAAQRREDAEGADDEADAADESLAGIEDLVEAALSREPEIRSLEERILQLTDAIQSQSQRSARGLSEPAVKRMLAQQKSLADQLGLTRERLRPQVANMIAQGGADRAGARGLSIARTPAAVVKVRQEMLAKSIAENQQELDNLTKEVKELGHANADLEVRRSEIEQLERVNNQIGMQLESTAIDLTSPSRVTQLEEATVPTDNDMIRRILLTGLIGIAGWLAGAGTVVLFEYARNRLNSPDEIAQGVGLKVIGTIPWIGSSKRERESEYRVAESVDGIRTMLLNGSREVPKVILVTSAGDREGKTSLAANLAASISRSDKRTLLVEGSLRNPSIHAAVQIDAAANGMAELLRGEVTDPNEVVQPTQIDGLFVVPAGNCDYDAIVSLSRPDLGRVIRSFRDTFDHVVIDGGSVLGSADPLIIGQHCDVALLSTMRDVSRMSHITAAIDRLRSAGIRLVGCVVCGTRESASNLKQRRIAG